MPETFLPWRWIATYTVRPEILCPLVYGKEYRIIVGVLRKAAKFADLYERAAALADGLASQCACPAGTVLHKRILRHGWFRHENYGLVRAFVTLGLSNLNADDPKPEGERPAMSEELLSPGGMTPDNVDVKTFTGKDFHESLSEGDLRDASDTTGVFTVSYGEYVESCEGIDYEPIVRRAERIASSTSEIVRREWFCATSPNIAVVHIYVRN